MDILAMKAVQAGGRMGISSTRLLPNSTYTIHCIVHCIKLHFTICYMKVYPQHSACNAQKPTRRLEQVCALDCFVGSLAAAHRLTLPPWIQQPLVGWWWLTNNTRQYFLPWIIGIHYQAIKRGNTLSLYTSFHEYRSTVDSSSRTKPILLHSGGNDWLWMKEVNLNLWWPKQSRTQSTNYYFDVIHFKWLFIHGGNDGLWFITYEWKKLTSNCIAPSKVLFSQQKS